MTQVERDRLDAHMAAPPKPMASSTRRSIWGAADEILQHGPLSPTGVPGATGLALGYVQSGKTTTITATIAAAADAGYRVIVALLGSTTLLLGQNKDRLAEALGIGVRTDYRWVELPNVSGARGAKAMAGWLAKDRVVLVPVLKHAGRITAVADVLSDVVAGRPDLPVLIIDDEADQASLNTKVNRGDESRTYEAIGALRKAAPRHLYVQFTATPFAPLLLEPDDHLRPGFVVLLHPGPGYTGGREFFVDNSEVVVRAIPTGDEQRPKALPTMLPNSLVTAFGNFVAGTALLLGADPAAPPVSMLVHSTQSNSIQERYRFLLERTLQRWIAESSAAAAVTDLPPDILSERARITDLGAPDLSDADFLDKVRYVLREATIWLVNTTSALKKVDWTVAPVHILIGGNKLDRGFTVEGLTVTYMNRPASEQLDTIEQRARAFGYRGDLLPFCQFFATPRTLGVLRQIVDTEYDLRAQLEDWLDAGNSVADWAEQIGLLMPNGTRPTRQNVLTTLAAFNPAPTWHQLRRPSLDPRHIADNAGLVAALGLGTAPPADHGRLWHPTLHLPLGEVVSQLLQPWTGAGPGHSPGWRQADLVALLSRMPDQAMEVPVLLMRRDGGGPRSRRWDPAVGFINLMQGRDVRPVPGAPSYPGDRAVCNVVADPGRIVVQVHHVQSTAPGVVPPVYTLAIHAGTRHLARRGS